MGRPISGCSCKMYQCRWALAAVSGGRSKHVYSRKQLFSRTDDCVVLCPRIGEAASLITSLSKELVFSSLFSFPGRILAYAGLPNPLYVRLFSGLNASPVYRGQPDLPQILAE